MAGGVEEEGAQAFLSEISEEDVEALRQREEALLQIEVRAPAHPNTLPHTSHHKDREAAGSAL